MTDRAALLSALAWQIELGADEAIVDTPQDRFAESTPVSKPGATAPRTPATPAKPATGATPRAPDRARGAAADARPVPSADPDHAAAATALAREAGTLKALATAMQSWSGSPLRETARNFVFADGNPSARLMVIGEAPGADEDRLGKPFVGRAGQLLDRMLAAIGLDRSAEDPAISAYITNILPWRPPGNRTPSEAEAQSFLPFVIRHIELAKPDLILSMGNTPTKALLATGTGIKRMRGTWRRHEATGLALLPSFHPAYLLRQPGDKRLAWADLLALRKALDGDAPLP